MAAENLRCKECGTEYPLEALYVCERCFGPLEVTYDYGFADDLATLRRRIGIVFQSFHLVPTMSALENVALPLEFAGKPQAAKQGRSTAASRDSCCWA